ncbi:MAG TPA: flavodoxin domain-containing protein [Spirochaetota bacterium]|nr:flavodoxin domain-containing protein [Spirochaetota bacterium]HOL58013.1 flavodoxin domain-containing protein [Spirochaetota bacterium]HPP04348.1 flavodoxin domain-containing protein [Spirochaetota bacterium]
MNIIIVYASYYGSTEKCAYKIKEKLKANSIIVNIAYNDFKNLNDYSTIIIGTPLHIGKIHKSIKKFLERFKDDLAKKNLHFFCCALEKDALEKSLKQIPEELISNIKVKECFGGRIVKSELSPFERVGIEMIEKKEKLDLTNYNTIDETKIDNFVKEVEKYI